MKLIMSWEGQAPCGAHWEEGSSLAQSWGQCFLPTVGAGLNDCPAAQENIWAPSASWHPLGWVWEHTGAFELPVFAQCPPLWDQGAAQQLWAGLGWFLILCSSLNPWPSAAPGYQQLCSVPPGWQRTGASHPFCSKLGHLVLPQVTSSRKSFLQGWRSLNPYYALTGIWHCLLEMDVRSRTHWNKGRTFLGCFCSHSDSETVINYLTNCQVSSELEHVHFLTM